MSNNLPVVRGTFLGMSGAAALGHSLSAFGFAVQIFNTSNTSAVKVEKDVVVGKDGDTDLHCDIYRPPAGAEKRMALVHLYGGGYPAALSRHSAARVRGTSWSRRRAFRESGCRSCR